MTGTWTRTVATWVVCTVITWVACSWPVSAWASRVVVVVSDDLPPYTQPILPFLDALGEPAEVYNLRGREVDARTLAKRLKDDPPDVVFALGAKAAWIMRKELPAVPLVYGSVLAPSRYDIIGRNTAGVSMVAAPELAVSQFKSFFESIKKVGVLRGPSIPDARIEAMQKAAALVGIEVIVERVRSPKDVRRALHRFTTRVDAIWLQSDRAVIDRPTYRFIVEECQRTRRPLIVETENMVRAGALFATVPDARGMGRQAAGVVREVLDDQRTLRGEVLDPNEVHVVLNRSVLREMGIPFETLMFDFVDVLVE